MLKTWVLVALALVVGGCNGRQKQDLVPVVVRSTQDLIGQINDNNKLIPNLWSRVDITVEWPGEKHSMGGYLILRKPSEHGQPPRDLRLKGGGSFGMVEFDMGSNSTGYWYELDAPNDKNDVYSFVPYGQESAGEAERALDLLSVLGVHELPTDMENGPWPVLRGYGEPPYYVLSFVEVHEGRKLRPRKDVWWHRRKQQVDFIELFDEEGHRYLSASLTDYQQFGEAKLATKIHIVWHGEKLSLDLKLRDVEVDSTRVSDKSFMHKRRD